MPVEFYQDDDTHRNKPGQFWRWRLKGDNGEIVAQGEGHATERDAQRSFERMVEIASQTLTEMESQGDSEKETT